MLGKDDEIRNALAGILAEALILIRNAGWRGEAARCAIEADHVHNLPPILRQDGINRELVVFYWNVERPAYVSQLARAGMPAADSCARFEQYWMSIEKLLALS